jgi:predicted GIY-YIG superfamily endonuclease
VNDHKKYWVYIVASRTGTLYIGMTNNLHVRVLQHKSGGVEGFSSDISLQSVGLLGEL